jgi:hypothetical protein
LLSVFSVALLPGCGKEGGPVKGYPKPGEMRLLSMDRQEAEIDNTNLIRNGDFHQWWAGAPVPNGFVQPSEATAMVKPIEAGDTKGIFQIWKTNERERQLEEMLRTESAPLEAGKTYTLEVTAASASGRLVTLDIWSRAEGAWLAVEPSFLSLQPQGLGVKTYRKSFTAKTAGPVTIAAASNGAVSDAPVAWLEWRLTAGGEATP